MARRVAVVDPLQGRPDLVARAARGSATAPPTPGTGRRGRARDRARTAAPAPAPGPRSVSTSVRRDAPHRRLSGRRSAGPAAASTAAPKWTPRPGSRCARGAPGRRSRRRTTGSYIGVRESLSPRNHAAASSIPSAHQPCPSIAYARAQASASAATSIGCWSNAGSGFSRSPPVGRDDRQVPVAGLPVEQPAPAGRARPRRARASPARRPRRAGPRAAPRSRSSAGVPATATGCRAQAGRSRRTAAVISARASAWPGTAASTSAAPSAANAIARGCGERRPAPRSNAVERPVPQVRRPRDGGPQTPQRAAPAVLDRRRVRSSPGRTDVGCGTGRRAPAPPARTSGTARGGRPARPSRAHGRRRPAPARRRRRSSRVPAAGRRRPRARTTRPRR